MSNTNEFYQAAEYKAKNVGTFEDGVMYTNAAECHKRWPQVSLATWKRYVGSGEVGPYILHKKRYYVTKEAAEAFAASKGWEAK